MPKNRRRGKLAMVHYTIAYLAATGKDEVMKFAYEWMNMERNMLSEMSQKENTQSNHTHPWDKKIIVCDYGW